MFEFTVEKENKPRKLSATEAEEIAKDIGNKFEQFDDLRARQKNIYKLLKKEIYLEDRHDGKKAAWKSQIFLNKIYSFFQTHQAYIWDNLYANVEQMFDVTGRDEESEKNARMQKAALVDSFDKMKIGKQLDPAVEHLDVIGEACLFVGWKRKVKRIRRRMSLAEQLESNGLLSLIRGRPEDAYGYFEQIIYDGAYVEAINPLNLVFDPAINPDNDEEWDKGLKIVKRFESYDMIAGNKFYNLGKSQLEEIKALLSKGSYDDNDKDDEAKIDEIVNGNMIEVLRLFGDYTLSDGTVLHNWSATVIGRRYLAQFEENQFVINPLINAATQRDPETKRGIPTLFSIYDLCKDMETKANLENDVQQLNANPMRYAPKGFFDKAVIDVEPGKVIEYKKGMDDPNMIVSIPVPLINNSQMINYLESETSLVSGIFPNMQGQQEDRKATATEINVKVAGQTTRLAKDIDLLKQNLIVAMVDKVADLEANMKSGVQRIFIYNEQGERIPVTVGDDIRQGNYEYRYTDSSGIQKRLRTNKESLEIFKFIWNDSTVALNKKEIIKQVLETIGLENTDRFFQAVPAALPQLPVNGGGNV